MVASARTEPVLRARCLVDGYLCATSTQKVRFSITTLMQTVIAADSSAEMVAMINISRQVIRSAITRRRDRGPLKTCPHATPLDRRRLPVEVCWL
jgi:hypothetical protein